jgi:hypothetical protein
VPPSPTGRRAGDKGKKCQVRFLLDLEGIMIKKEWRQAQQTKNPIKKGA